MVAGFEWIDEEGSLRYALDTIGYTWDSTPRITLSGPAGAANPIDSGDDLIYAGDGNDTVLGQAGDDVIYGEGGDDILDGDLEASGASHLPGEYHGNDFIDGGSGDDAIRGLGGNDVLFGGEGADTLIGNGNDITSLLWVGTVRKILTHHRLENVA
ncbi:MAG: calcium-binding protein [Pseudomonadota bacterium]